MSESGRPAESFRDSLPRYFIYAIFGVSFLLLAFGGYVAALRYADRVPPDLRRNVLLSQIRPGMSSDAVDSLLRDGPPQATSLIVSRMSLNSQMSIGGGHVQRYQIDNLRAFSVVYSPDEKVVVVMPGG